MFLIVGLGNPGAEYQHTRHNAGFLVVDRFIASRGLERPRQRYHGRWLEAMVEKQRLALLKPLTYMNRSGLAVAEASLRKHIPPENIVVVHDEMDFPFGVVRAKQGGGLGGHNGLSSIAASLGTNEFNRVRVGIGRPPVEFADARDWVLSPFDQCGPELETVLDAAADCFWTIVSEGIEAAMNRFNRRPDEGSAR